MSNILRVGVIGCGGIANGKHFPALQKNKHTEVVAFCDIELDKAISAKEKFGSESSLVYSDYKELLKDASIDVVHVCTPNDSHAFITIDALEAGKHVMCEKPMAKTAQEARDMVAAAKRTGKKLSIGYNNRFRPDSLQLKELCDADELGEIYYAKAHAVRRRAVPIWGVFLDKEKQGGGPLIDIGTHALDLTLWMMNNYKPKSVTGSVFHKLSKNENAANAWGSWDPEKFTVEDSAVGFIKMENGATIVLESSWALNTLEVDEAKCTLCGTKAGADMKDGLRINGEQNKKLYVKEFSMSASGVAFYDGSLEKDIDAELKAWVNAILNDEDPVVLPEQTLVVTEILEAIYESAKTGETIYFT